MIESIWNWFTGLIGNQYAGWIFAALLVLITLLGKLSETISSLKTIKASILTPLASWFGHKKLVKAAIKNDIEGNVNKVVDKIRGELPDGWADPLSIQWVASESVENFIQDNQPVLRIKPLKEASGNFSQAVYLYFSNTFFPQVKSILPEAHTEAATLQFCRRVITDGKPSARESFENDVLEPALQRQPTIAKFLERLDKIDKKGLLTGVFIREVHNIALKVRFTTKRQSVGSEFSEVLTHLEEFADGVKAKKPLEDYQWSRKGPVCTYGLVLVAMPSKAASGAVKGYVNRAKEKANKKVDHLYVFGTSEEVKFANEVIQAIQEGVVEYKMKQQYKLYRDYRGKRGGIGALFTLKDKS